jgi:hypothetical protein
LIGYFEKGASGITVDNEWPFKDPKNLASISIRQIIVDGAPILRVSHDEDDGCWQFLGWETPKEEDAMVVGLSTVVDSDPSIKQLADLPVGWRAWRRSYKEPWVREMIQGDTD